MPSKLLYSVTIPLLACQAGLSQEAENGSQQPNLLIIHTDEHNFRTLGCYRDILDDKQAFMWGRESIVETPNIDRLAEEGVLCTNWYAASPVSTPSIGLKKNYTDKWNCLVNHCLKKELL
ncbi:MAG: sulfatase-like hydrolase/transferase [Bacteroidales bacterium]|nr:sulfatase-like hydrolase/transferase [Bacteroidales bacterium]